MHEDEGMSKADGKPASSPALNPASPYTLTPGRFFWLNLQSSAQPIMTSCLPICDPPGRSQSHQTMTCPIPGRTDTLPFHLFLCRLRNAASAHQPRSCLLWGGEVGGELVVMAI